MQEVYINHQTWKKEEEEEEEHASSHEKFFWGWGQAAQSLDSRSSQFILYSVDSVWVVSDSKKKIGPISSNYAKIVSLKY